MAFKVHGVSAEEHEPHTNFEMRGPSSAFAARFATFLSCTYLVTLLVSAVEKELCRTLHFTPPVPGRALKDHVIQNLSVKMPGSCRTACLLENDCVSYNLGPLKDSEYVCELSDSDHTLHGDDLVPRHGFTYQATENACSSNPCVHGKCQNGITAKKYKCDCKEGYLGDRCDRESLQKVNTDPVCFGAADGTEASFNMQTAGFVHALKLVYRSGSVRCSPNAPPSFWGCMHRNYGDKRLSTMIAYPNGTLLLPAEDLFQTIGTCRSYGLAGVYYNSSELLFPPFGSPIRVSTGQEFKIWYTQDFDDCSDKNNVGKTCADVYAWFV